MITTISKSVSRAVLAAFILVVSLGGAFNMDQTQFVLCLDACHGHVAVESACTGHDTHADHSNAAASPHHHQGHCLDIVLLSYNARHYTASDSLDKPSGTLSAATTSAPAFPVVNTINATSVLESPPPGHLAMLRSVMLRC